MTHAPALRPTEDWQTKLAGTTRFVVAIVKLTRSIHPDEVRTAVIAHAREALGGRESGHYFKCPPCRFTDDGGVFVEHSKESTPGILHLALDESPIDPRDPMQAETFMLVVQRAVDSILSDPEDYASLCRGAKDLKLEVASSNRVSIAKNNLNNS